MSDIADEFDGDNALLVESALALIDLSDRGAVVPPLGGHARKILSAFAVRMGEARFPQK